MTRGLLACLVVLLGGVTVSVPGFAATAMYHYTPAISELRGTIERQAFPGRPNYESMEHGDEMERGWYLRLRSPIEVVFDQKTSDGNAETERGVKIIQITWSDDSLDAKIRQGGLVTLKGNLFHRWNGHHHTRVLLDVSEAKASR